MVDIEHQHITSYLKMLLVFKSLITSRDAKCLKALN